jgi:hypothetical protein
MPEQVLGVGEELVIAGGIRLTLLAVEAGEVLCGITAPAPKLGLVQYTGKTAGRVESSDLTDQGEELHDRLSGSNDGW